MIEQIHEEPIIQSNEEPIIQSSPNIIEENIQQGIVIERIHEEPIIQQHEEPIIIQQHEELPTTQSRKELPKRIIRSREELPRRIIQPHLNQSSNIIPSKVGQSGIRSPDEEKIFEDRIKAIFLEKERRQRRIDKERDEARNAEVLKKLKYVEEVMALTVKIDNIALIPENAIFQLILPVKRIDIPRFKLRERWEDRNVRYKRAQDILATNIFVNNRRIKIACNRVLSQTEFPDEEYKKLKEILNQRDEELYRMALIARYFALHIPHPMELESEEELESWMKDECYKMNHSISIYASDNEKNIFKIYNYIVLSKEDKDALYDTLHGPDSPMISEYFNTHVTCYK